MSSDFDDIYEALMSDVRNYNKIIKSNLSTYNATKSWLLFNDDDLKHYGLYSDTNACVVCNQSFRNQKGKHGHYKTSKNHQLSIYNT